MVNSMNSKLNKNNSINSDSHDDLAELTIPRMKSRANNDLHIVYNGFSGVSKNATLNASNKFKLPFSLSDKINTLMENKINIQKSMNTHDSNKTSDNPCDDVHKAASPRNKRFEEKHNYVIFFLNPSFIKLKLAKFLIFV